MCGLSLAWVTCENSTKLLESDFLSQSSSLDPILSPTVSGVRCWLPLSVVPRQLSLLSRRQLPRPGPPSTPLSSFVQPTLISCPLPTSGYGEISGPRILCLVSRQNRQRNRLLWQPTHIVLHWNCFQEPQKDTDETDQSKKRDHSNHGIKII